MSGFLGWTVPRACPHHRPEFNTLKNAFKHPLQRWCSPHKRPHHAHLTRTFTPVHPNSTEPQDFP